MKWAARGSRAYLGGPMSGRLELNREAFQQFAKWWREMGYVVISPWEIDQVLGFTVENPPKWEDALAWDALIIPTCDIMLLLPGWRKSAGVWREINVALEHGIPIYNAMTGDSLNYEARKHAEKPMPERVAV